MRGGIRIGNILGIPLYIDSSWFLILGFLAVWLSAAFNRLSPDFALGYGIITALLFFLSIALGRIAHALTAKAQGLAISSINIQFMGNGNGANSQIEKEGRTPFSVFSIAISSPLTNLGLSVIGFIAAWLLAGDTVFTYNPKLQETLPAIIGSSRTAWTIITLNFARVNLIFFVFSLIPALPFEGGHILKALVWKITGDRFKGIRWAARSGQIFGGLLMVLAILVFLRDILGGMLLMFFGWLLLGNAGGYLYFNNLQQILLDIDAESAMTRDFRVVDGEMSLRNFADKFLLMEEKDAHPIYVASTNGRDRGIVLSDSIRNIDSQSWQTQTLESITTPFDEIDTVEQKTKLFAVINLLEQKQLRHVIVRSAVGSVAGVIDHGDIIKALDLRLQWRIPSEYIKQIKNEGKFPINFRLSEICQQLEDH
ncbi:MAG: site-2 protease family protein [Pseudanabaenaceae cyanobacterium bins.39]|nr:site-2 protease family protein [Pseudanabaenaceae cyanobacterium bins.39]